MEQLDKIINAATAIQHGRKKLEALNEEVATLQGRRDCLARAVEKHERILSDLVAPSPPRPADNGGDPRFDMYPRGRMKNRRTRTRHGQVEGFYTGADYVMGARKSNVGTTTIVEDRRGVWLNEDGRRAVVRFLDKYRGRDPKTGRIDRSQPTPTDS